MTREVTEYGLQVPATVLGKRRKLTPEQLAELDQIEYQLALDPDKHGDRLVPLPDGGGTFMYEHPDPRLQITFKLDRARKVLRILNEAAPCFQPRNFIFLSYSHVDETLFLEFKLYLSTLAERGLVQFWSDKNIKPGVAWNDEILDALASCRAALLLVSQDFLRSAFIRTEEVPRLEQRAQREGMKLYWIPLRPSMVKEDTTISKYQALMDITTSLAEIRRNRPKYERTLTEITRLLYEEVKEWASPAQRQS